MPNVLQVWGALGAPLHHFVLSRPAAHRDQRSIRQRIRSSLTLRLLVASHAVRWCAVTAEDFGAAVQEATYAGFPLVSNAFPGYFCVFLDGVPSHLGADQQWGDYRDHSG